VGGELYMYIQTVCARVMSETCLLYKFELSRKREDRETKQARVMLCVDVVVVEGIVQMCYTTEKKREGGCLNDRVFTTYSRPKIPFQVCATERSPSQTPLPTPPKQS